MVTLVRRLFPARDRWRHGTDSYNDPRPQSLHLFLGGGAPLCVTELGFSLHAATRAAATDTRGCEALVRYAVHPRNVVTLDVEPRSDLGEA